MADTPSLRSDLAAGTSVSLGAGVFPISSMLTLTANSQVLEGIGPRTIIRADSASDFKTCLYGTALTGVAVRNLVIDCNRAARLAILTTRTLGLYLQGCSDAIVEGVTVRGTVGGPDTAGGTAMSAVAIAMTQGTRNVARRCTCRDCGTTTAGQASDAFYTSGDDTKIIQCRAIDSSDTAFVLENSNRGLIANCRSIRCSVGFAITNASSSLKTGNTAVNIEVVDFSTSVTGGVQVGLPIATASGNLTATTIANVSLGLKAGGTGPAVNIRNVGTGLVSGVTMKNVKVAGAGTQGVLIVGEGVTLADCQISDTGASAVQVQTGCADIEVKRTKITNPTSFGVVTSGTVDGVTVADNVIVGTGAMTYGIWLSSATTNDVMSGNTITGYTGGLSGRQTP